MRILLGIDGSQYSQAAIDELISRGSDSDVQIKVVSVVDFEEPLPSLEGAKEAEIAAAHELVKQAVKALNVRFVDVEGEVLDGLVIEEIVESAQNWSADLVVVGSQGLSGLEEFFLGGVSKGVMVGAHCAVRIVRSGVSPGHNVLVALDDSEHSRYALEHILASAWSSETIFKCVTVVPEVHEHFFLDHKYAQARAITHQRDVLQLKALGFLQQFVKKLEDRFGPGRASLEVLHGDPRKQILEVSNSWPADLIILGSHGQRFMSRFIFGSVSEAVATHAKCSVEVTKAPETKHGQNTSLNDRTLARATSS